MAKVAAKKSENQIDPRRETLVMECKTTWPEGCALSQAEKERLAGLMHGMPDQVKKLDYIRSPTGLIRHITVSDEDLTKFGAKA